MQKKTSRKPSAFTLMEIIIIVAIIGLLAAIAIPNFVRAKQTRDKNRCVLNLRTIEAAKAAFSKESKKPDAYQVSADDLYKYGATNRMGEDLKCPAGDMYDLGTITTKLATCPVVGHELPK
ncbi:MAG: hypothetical protein UU95_C0023G0002 [Parcubacteria group bacterium GW2011_GWC2_42_12]|nr:MAG: hypothetical protein UU95_C0023G0002 [Parcubacteria group bacterium GW2011_GWC2_42_12]